MAIDRTKSPLSALPPVFPVVHFFKQFHDLRGKENWRLEQTSVLTREDTVMYVRE